MDMRRKNFKENKQNCNSMADFTKNIERSLINSPDQDLRQKVRQLELKLNNLIEVQKLESDKSRGQNLKIGGSVSLLEKQIAALNRDNVRISNKNETGKQSRIRLSVQKSLKTLERAETNENIQMDFVTQRQELRIQKMKWEQLQIRQNRLQEEVRELTESKRGNSDIKLARNNLQIQRFDTNKQTKQYGKSKLQASQKIQFLSHGLQKSLASFKDDWKNFKREETQKLEEIKGLNMVGELGRSRIQQKDHNIDIINGDLATWKRVVESKITRLCEQVTCSMKGSKQYWRKQHDELAKEALQTAKSIVQVRQTLSKKFDKEMKGIVAVMNDQFNSFTHELEQMNEMISLAKKELQNNLQNESNSLKELINQASLVTRSKIQEIQCNVGKTLQDYNRHMRKEISKIGKLTNNQIESMASIEQTLHKVGKTSDQTEKVNKMAENLKTQVDGKLKAAYDRIILDWNVKKQFEQKAKAEQARQRQIKQAEMEKKLSDLSGKIKSELRSEFSKKVEKNSKEDVEVVNKQIEKYISSFKKQLQSQIEGDKNLLNNEINRIKFEMKTKEQMYNPQNTAKRESERKKKEEQIQLKFEIMSGQIKETVSMTKAEMEVEMNKLKSSQNEHIVKIRNELQGNIRSLEDSIKRKQSQSKMKEQQSRRRQNDTKSLQKELENKFKSLKLWSEEYTAKEIERLKTDIYGKIGKNRQQTASNVRILSDQIKNTHQELSSAIEELSQLGDTIRVQVDKKLAELTGVSLISMKAQQQEGKKEHQRKLECLRSEMKAVFDSRIEITQNQVKTLNSKLEEMAKEDFRVKTQVSNILIATQNAINHIEADLFTEKQKNKAVYQKMSSDLVDISDSLMVMMSELKPAKK